MKISYKPVSNFKIIRRIDEFICPPPVWLYKSVSSNTCFKSTASTCAYHKNLLPGGNSFIYFFSRGMGYFEIFRIHFMFCKVFNFNGTKSSQANMKYNRDNFDSFLFYFL